MNKKIYLDVKDLLEYVAHNTTYSGIQRVASEFLFYCFEQYPDHIVPVAPGGRSFLKTYDITILKQIHEQIISGSASRIILDKLLSDLKKTELEADINHDSVYFMIGAFWIYEDYKYIIDLKRSGLPFVLFVHDLIQIRNKEYVLQDANSKFIQSFSDVLYLADLIIANSYYVAADIKKFIDEQMKNNLLVLPEVVSAPLATVHKHVTPTFADHTLLRTLGLDTGSYVLCVGTMEIRKNNLYLVKVWEKLIRIHGANNIPRLVFCGKRGWHNEEFFDYIEDKQYVGTWLHLIESAPETLLSLLYEKSLFTCFVSYAEGWGLPISESLSYGKLCVASKTTSMPEVGGEFCLYIDPYDTNSGFDVINKLIVDKDFFHCRGDFIKNNHKEKTWREFSQEIIGFIDNSKLINQSSAYCFIPPSTVTSTGNYDIRKAVDLDKPILSSKMAATSGWHQIEDWGIWASKNVAIFECAIESKKDTLISCFIKLKCPEEMVFTTVSVVQSGVIIETFNVTSNPQWYTFDTEIYIDSRLEIKLVSPSRRFVSPDNRGQIFFGILGFAYSSGDLISTVSLIKKVINDGVNIININAMDQKETSTDIPKKEFEVIGTEIAANAIADFVSIFYSEMKPSFFERFVGSLYLQKARVNARKKRWSAAAMCYIKMFKRGLIGAKPIVQFGHALNESGLHRAAIIAYSIAYRLSPDDDDVKFHYELNLERLRKYKC